MTAKQFYYTLLFLFAFPYLIFSQASFPFSYSPLTEKTDLSAKMVTGVDNFLSRETDRIKNLRSGFWNRDFSSPAAFQQSVAAEFAYLSSRLGVAENRVTPAMQLLTNLHANGLKPFTLDLPGYTITAVRWQVLDGLFAEGLLLQPKGKILARIVMVPDADVEPEVLAGLQQSAFAGYGAALQLTNAGCEVLIPVLVNRNNQYSGSSSLQIFTNQPHREWLYRQAYEVGRHVIGYELQKIFSAIDWLESRNKLTGKGVQIGVAGHGEGGLLALYAAALDTRIQCTLVSGYFDQREKLWQEPIYRNVFGLLNHFGDAEIAVMAWPRKLIIEYAKGPELTGPPKPTENRSGAAPGILTTPAYENAAAEFERAKSIVTGTNHLQWVTTNTKLPAGNPFSTPALKDFMLALHVAYSTTIPPTKLIVRPIDWVDADQRQERTVKEMELHIQQVVDTCYRTRDKNFWQMIEGEKSELQAKKAAHRKRLGQVLGELPIPTIAANPRARLLQETEKWTSYEITLDVYAPDVFAWGILLIPKGLKAGEKRPVVVCQHGLEGLPTDLLTTDTNTQAYGYYKAFAVKLAEQGYVTFAPHNYYRGEDKFRVLQRKANPIGLTLFSVITSQHRRIVEWLGQQSFVDPARIGFYGLSYGGKTAMRVPALVEAYALSICSADFNEWVLKNSTVNYPISYLYTGEYDMPEWDLGHTFNYAEMAALIAPRPFMVERGHDDGVSIDEWVDFEYAKVRRHYAEIGLPENTVIEHFKGPHTIHGVGSFEFLNKHLKNQ